MEDKYVNLTGQLSSVTERLDHAERDLDLERISREDIIEPLYKLQYQRVMKAILLAADGSPIPLLDNEKHKTVMQYIIEYRSIDTGIPVFLSTPPMEGIKGVSNGKGKKIIEAHRIETYRYNTKRRSTQASS